MGRGRHRAPARAGAGGVATASSRLFDVALEEPDLLEPERRAQTDRRGTRRAGRAAVGKGERADGRRGEERADGRRGGRADGRRGEGRAAVGKGGRADGGKGERADRRIRERADGLRGERADGGDEQAADRWVSRKDGAGEPKVAGRDRRRKAAAAAAGDGAGRHGASPMIDPRIAARRAQVQADEAAAGHRRRRRLAMAAIGVVALVGAGALVLLSPVASVRTIEVRGAERTGAPAVRNASGLSAGPPLLRVDERRVAARLAALPWVRRARLERRWPRTVVLTVEERRPAAVAPCLGGRATSCLVDADGRVLAAATDDPKTAAALPHLVEVPPAGEPGATVPEAVRGPLAVAVALPDALRPLVREVRGEGTEVALDLQAPGRATTPPVVRIGRPERISEKLTAAATVLARTSVNGVDVLDVRVPESPALTRLRR